jgi:flagellar hook protein FlgE
MKKGCSAPETPILPLPWLRGRPWSEHRAQEVGEPCRGGALELSNVDIATEFANLIVAQNAFEANSKSVTTFDTIAQDTINLVQPT